MDKEWYSVEELAKEWGLKEETIRQYIRTKQLEAVRFGNTYRVHKDAKEKFIDERRTGRKDE
jgi:excisionase family DNA binding protein